jgi:hypothetical protein
MKFKNNLAKELNFNISRNRFLKIRRFFKKAFWTLVIILFLSPGIYLFLNYLANTPRERNARNYTYWQRVIAGAKFNYQLTLNKLTAHQDDPANSQLPLVEIYIKKDRLQMLSEHLPESGKIFQAGMFKERLKNKKDLVYNADLRFRGDSMNHWAFPQKSWRVKLKKDVRYQGLKQFNLYLPRSKSQIPDFLGYQLASKMGGLIVPKAFPVHFRLNRKFDGLRVCLEQLNQDFLITNKINSDRILVGDIDFKDVYGDQKRDHLFQEISGWEIISPNPNLSVNTNEGSRELRGIISALPLAETDPAKFKMEIEQFLDLQSTLKYMAFLEIVNSAHIDNSHNQRFYLDLDIKKLKPIVWDPVAYYWGSSDRIDLCSNNLFSSLLLIPEYREQKNKYIWEALNGELAPNKVTEMIKDAASKIRSEVYSSPQKIYTYSNALGVFSNAEWEIAVNDLINTSNDRSNRLLNQLKTTTVIATVDNKNQSLELELSVEGNSSIILEELKFKLINQKANSISQLLIEKDQLPRIVPVENKSENNLVLKINDKLYTKRIKKNAKAIARAPVTYKYKIQLTQESLILEELNIRNSITDAVSIIKVNSGSKL